MRLLLGICVSATLCGCFSTGHPQSTKTVNTALTGACLAARLSPCTIQPTKAEKAQATEAKAALVRANARRDSAAADQEAAVHSSCVTDTGPRLPVTSGQCAAYGGATSPPPPAPPGSQAWR